MLDKLREYTKAFAGTIAPLVAIAIIANVEKLDDLDTAWKAVIIAAVNFIAIALSPKNKEPTPPLPPEE